MTEERLKELGAVCRGELVCRAQAAAIELIAEVRRLRESLDGAIHRFKLMKDSTKCIGATLCHVNFNCIHCGARFSEELARSALKGTS